MRKGGLFNPLLLVLCWTGLVAAGAYVLADTAIRQYKARNFLVTMGRMVRSEVGQSNIMRRGVVVEYTYVVNGVKYDGHRFRYDDHNIVFEWDSTVEGMPRGAAHKVYYNPENPADALLQPGVDGADLLVPLFALPILVLTVLFWQLLYLRWRELRGPGGAAGGVRLALRPGRVRVKLGQTSAFGAAVCTMAAIAFVASFPAVIFGGFDPPMRMMHRIWAIVAGGGILVFTWRMGINLAGNYELRIEKTADRVVLPKAGGRRERLSIARSEIGGVLLQRRIIQGPSGTNQSYLPALKRNGVQAGEPPLALINWGWDEEKARAFGEWLARELGTKFLGVMDEAAQAGPAGKPVLVH